MDGALATCSIIQRLNKSSLSTSSNGSAGGESAVAAISAGLISASSANGAAVDLSAVSASGSTVRFKNVSPPHSVSSYPSRPPSVEKLHQDMFTTVATMGQAKCAVGAACLDGKLVVCGKNFSLTKQRRYLHIILHRWLRSRRVPGHGLRL